MIARRLPATWSGREGLRVLLAFVFVYIALSMAHMLVVKYTVGFAVHLGHGPRMPPQLLLISQGIKAVAIVVVLWLVALRPRALPWRTLGLKPCAPRWYVAAVAVALAGFMVALVLAKVLVTAVPDWARFTASRYAWQDGSPALMLTLLAMTILVTPFVEELFFRGFLFRWMASTRPLWLAVLASSLMFGASHIVPSQAIVAALMSVLLIGLFLASGSVWPSVLCHALYNALGALFGMAAVAGKLPQWLTP